MKTKEISNFPYLKTNSQPQRIVRKQHINHLPLDSWKEILIFIT